MLDVLRAWLNGKRDYQNGVIIYASVGNKPELLSLFTKGKNDFRERKLISELQLICSQLKLQSNAGQVIARGLPGIPHLLPGNIHNLPNKNAPISQGIQSRKREIQKAPGSSERKIETSPVNPELYISCKEAADKKYKQTMNDRAVLIALSKCDTWENPNLPHKIAERTKLALDVVQGFQSASLLFDQVDHVRVHGHLPDQGEADLNEYDHLADSLVKQTLDNLRKNYNKIKQREPTPERVALLQKHEANIKKLNAKWLLLKPRQQ